MTPTAELPGRTDRTDYRDAVYQELKSRIHEELLNRLNLDRLAEIKREEGEPEIRGLISAMFDREYAGTPLSLGERESLTTDVLNELFGLGPLEPLLADPDISDILVNRFDRVYIERNGMLTEADAVTFKDERHLLRIIERIVSSVGRRIDESHPMVDARLLDGSRVNAVIPPLALDGAAVSIRRFRTDRLGHQDLVERDSLTQPMLDFLRAAIGCRLNVLVSGGTGAGKTTLLNVLSSFISERERIITIEDAAELVLRQRHVVRMETRPANIEGKGAIRQRELVINSLRMRPDRIIVGEVRGEEALDMMQAMNTGHDGSLTTIHSNSPRDALYRLNTMIAMANLNIPDKAIRQQIASALDLIIQVTRHGGRHPQGDVDLRGHGNGRRSHHDAGDLHFRADGPHPRRKGRRAVPGDGHPAQMQRTAGLRRPAAANGHVRTLQDGQRGRRSMTLPWSSLLQCSRSSSGRTFCSSFGRGSRAAEAKKRLKDSGRKMQGRAAIVKEIEQLSSVTILDRAARSCAARCRAGPTLDRAVGIKNDGGLVFPGHRLRRRHSDSDCAAGDRAIRNSLSDRRAYGRDSLSLVAATPNEDSSNSKSSSPKAST